VLERRAAWRYARDLFFSSEPHTIPGDVAFLNPRAQTDRAICGVHFMAIVVQALRKPAGYSFEADGSELIRTKEIRTLNSYRTTNPPAAGVKGD
jgi:hypothetical protein